MATNVGNLVVKLTADMADLKKGLDQAGKEIQGFGGKTKAWFNESKVAIGAAIGGISAAIVTSIQAYGEQEQAVVSLNQALANQGKYSQATSKDLQDFATSLQNVTTYGDEAIISVQSQLVAFGLEGDALKKTTKATLDLASAKKIDLASAAQLLGKAFVGETGSLSRYGIVLGENIPKSEKFAVALGKVNQMFGGQAEAQRKTTLGQLEGMKNAFSDLQEEIGAFLAADAVGFVTWITSFIQNMTSSIAIIRNFTVEMGGLGFSLKSVMLEAVRAVILALIDYIKYVSMLGPILKLLGIDIDAIRMKIEAKMDTMQMDSQAAGVNAAANTTAQKGIQQEFRNTAIVQAEQAAVMQEKHKVLTDDYVTRWVAAKQEQMAWDTKATEILDMNSLQWTTNAKSMANSVFNNFGQGMADMIMEGKKFSDVLKNIWRDLARQIIAYITQMIAKWLVLQAITGGRAGTLLHVAGLAGMAEGGVINEPSVITGIRSGKSMIAGEKGKEYVVPEGGITDVGSGGIGGGGNLSVTVNISGQFVDANENVWQRLVKDKIVPEIRRITMSNPTGMFNRRRGATA